MSNPTRQDDQRPNSRQWNAIDREAQREGDRDLCERLLMSRYEINGYSRRRDGSLEHQACERIERLERCLRDVIASDTLERAKAWARSELP